MFRNARRVGCRSINVDLIYRLPYQPRGSFRVTVNRIVAALPDRVSVFSYAHLPARFELRRQIDERSLPSASEKPAILRQIAEQSLNAGYCRIGMDHFARPEDELAVAQRERRLRRNFQGCSTCADRRLPRVRGLELNEDDRIRRNAISESIRHFRLMFDEVDDRSGIDSRRNFFR